MSSGVVFIPFREMSSFFLPSTLLIKYIAWKWRYDSNVVGTPISNVICTLAWQVSSTICKNSVRLSRATQKFLLQKTWKDSFRVRLSFFPCIFTATDALISLQIGSVSSSRSTMFLLFRNWYFFVQSSSANPLLLFSLWSLHRMERRVYQPTLERSSQ